MAADADAATTAAGAGGTETEAGEASEAELLRAITRYAPQPELATDAHRWLGPGGGVHGGTMQGPTCRSGANVGAQVARQGVSTDASSA